jgi:GTP cyclohydrolase II
MPLVAGVNEDNRDYLSTKVERMGHSISDDDLES